MARLTKLTAQERYAVMRSREPRKVLAARYGISPDYVTQLRGGAGQDGPPRGLRDGFTWLTDAQCVALLRRWKSGESPTRLAAAYGKSRDWVYQFVHGRTRRALWEGQRGR